MPFHDRILLNSDINRLLAEMWSTMASGPAIDDQADARWGSGVTLPNSASSGSALPPGDVDFDPNDLAPAGWAASAQSSQPCQMLDWDDLDDEEDEFYGR